MPEAKVAAAEVEAWNIDRIPFRCLQMLSNQPSNHPAQPRKETHPIHPSWVHPGGQEGEKNLSPQPPLFGRWGTQPHLVGQTCVFPTMWGGESGLLATNTLDRTLVSAYFKVSNAGNRTFATSEVRVGLGILVHSGFWPVVTWSLALCFPLSLMFGLEGLFGTVDLQSSVRQRIPDWIHGFIKAFARV